ncbi:sulfatase [Amycolatopsis antarctica]|uniref:Sulfatase n=1 Tax=Amycolatopsis antarctica TaxID=1854586 RepID=A0A263CVN5_9PSEU|nr:sulfatase [Amycolatopsis antarctica]
MLVGAGLLVAPAAAAAAAGWWSLAGVPLAAVLGLLSARAGAADPHAAAVPVTGWAAAVTRGARFAASTATVALLASVFGAYVVPDAPATAAVLLVLASALADVAGARLNPGACRWITAVLLLAAAALVAVCLAVPPVPGPSATAGPDGIVLAAAVFVPFLAAPGRTRTSWRDALAVLVVLAVGAVALFQLGPARLGLAPTSARDLLAAADAGALGVLLALTVAVATVPAGLLALGAARRSAADSEGSHDSDGVDETVRGRATAVLPVAVLAAAGSAVFGPFDLLLLAAATALFALLTVNLLRYKRSRGPFALMTAALAVALAVAVPFVHLGIALGSVALGAGLAATRYGERRD